MLKCNYDCFNCIYDDCLVDTKTMTKEEREDAKYRDKVYQEYGSSFIKMRPQRAKHRGRR